MRQALLAKQFIKESKNQEISPALFNSAVPIQTSGWNRDVYFNPYYKTRLPYPTFLSMKGKEGALFYCIDKTRILGEEIFNNFIKNPAVLGNISSDYETFSKKIHQLYTQTTEKNILASSEKTLAKRIKNAINQMWKLNARLFFTIPIEEELLAKIISVNKIDIPLNRLKALWQTVMRYGGNSFETRRKINFAEYIKEGLSAENLAEPLSYYYTNYNTYCNKNTALGRLKNDYAEILTPKKANTYLLQQQRLQKNNNYRLKKAITKFSKQEKQIVNFLIAAIQLRDRRKDDIAKTCAIVYKIGSKYFKQANVPFRLIYFCTLPELLKGPKYVGKIFPVLRKRIKGVSILVKDSGALVIQNNYHKQNLKLLEQNMIANHKDRGNKIIQGQMANPGKAKGVVSVVKSLFTDGKKFKPGSILVTGMTRPEYIYIMKQAAAIITDEGGITSHAAIVSRELGIPCVIGTKIATKIFKNGDIVEVDANKGIVKMVNP